MLYLSPVHIIGLFEHFLGEKRPFFVDFYKNFDSFAFFPLQLSILPLLKPILPSSVHFTNHFHSVAAKLSLHFPYPLQISHLRPSI